MRPVQSVRHWRVSDHADDKHPSAARHLNVFRGIADVDAGCGCDADAAQSDLQLRGMRFPARHLITENAGSEECVQAEGSNLRPNAPSAAAGDQTEPIALRESLKDASCARLESWPLLVVETPPKPVRFAPPLSRELRGAIDIVPVGRAASS